ncbi:MAG: response regulator [Acidobacteria bacterium]|nr:response regulator [Acidobacteriota bacterium]
MSTISILYLEDSLIDLQLSLSLLRKAGIEYTVEHVETEAGYESALRKGHFDLILADYSLPQFDGLAALEIARRVRPQTPFIFVSGVIGEEVAVDSLQRGATDFVLKQRPQRLATAVRRALAEAAEKRARMAAEEERAALLDKEKARVEELAGVNQRLEQFAYAASHDLQEPVRMIKVYSQLLAKRYGDQLDEAGRQYMSFIETGATRMDNLVQDLLAYSRVTHMDRESMRAVELREVLHNLVIPLFQPALWENDAEIHVDASLPVVHGDAERLSQVFQNLISNSLKYRRRDVPPRIYISAVRQDNDWLIAVRDNGIGFEKEYGERIFGLFKRLHKGDLPGTGVGLALAKQIVEKHGGRIWADSTPGEGSTFYFTLAAPAANA